MLMASSISTLSPTMSCSTQAIAVDETLPTVASAAETPSTGDLNAGKTVTIALTTREAVCSAYVAALAEGLLPTESWGA
jgi:hypothetical protein